MKKYVIFGFFLLFSTISFAQVFRDVVHLKNGSIIRGIIVEQIPGKSIKIETADKNLFVYKIDEIEKMTKEQVKKSQNTYGSDNFDTNFESGYKGIVELGYMIGTGNYGIDRIKLNIINGYQVNPNFYFGIGTGLRYYTGNGFDAAIIPIFADLRGTLVLDNVVPYLSLDVGYPLNTASFEKLGFLFNPTIGVGFKISKKSVFTVGLGYELQKMKFSYYDYYDFYESSVNSGAFSINLGILF
jgi:hypothetical protein